MQGKSRVAGAPTVAGLQAAAAIDVPGVVCQRTLSSASDRGAAPPCRLPTAPIGDARQRNNWEAATVPSR